VFLADILVWLIITFMSWQTFMDIAVLVDEQGDMLNNIESQVIFHHFAYNVTTIWS
jgi:hypothetical protein